MWWFHLSIFRCWLRIYFHHYNSLFFIFYCSTIVCRVCRRCIGAILVCTRPRAFSIWSLVVGFPHDASPLSWKVPNSHGNVSSFFFLTHLSKSCMRKKKTQEINQAVSALFRHRWICPRCRRCVDLLWNYNNIQNKCARTPHSATA